MRISSPLIVLRFSVKVLSAASLVYMISQGVADEKVRGTHDEGNILRDALLHTLLGLFRHLCRRRKGVLHDPSDIRYLPGLASWLKWIDTGVSAKRRALRALEGLTGNHRSCSRNSSTCASVKGSNSRNVSVLTAGTAPIGARPRTLGSDSFISDWK